MILQLGSLFSAGLSGLTNLFGGAAAPASTGFFSSLGNTITQAFTQNVIPAATQLGADLLGGLAREELNRRTRRAQNDAIKAGVRQAFTAASPVVAPSQGPVFSGGAPTGTPFAPPTVTPPSTAPLPQVLQINPNFLLPPPPGAPVVTSAGTVVRAGGLARFVDTRAPSRTGTPMLPDLEGVFGQPAGPVFGFGNAPLPTPVSTGGALMANGGGATGTFPLATMHRYTRNRMNTGSQIFVPNVGGGARGAETGPPMVPIEIAPQLGIDTVGLPRFRFDLVKREFTKLKRRRMNPANTRAFMRAGRRIEAMERIARKLFSERSRERKAKVKRRRTKKKR